MKNYKLASYSVVSHNCDLSDRKAVVKIIQDLHPDKEVVVVSNKGKLLLKNSLQYICKVLNVTYPKKYYVDNGLFFSKLIEKHEIRSNQIDKFMELKEAIKLSRWILAEHKLDLEQMLNILVGNVSSTGVHAGGVCILEKDQGIVPYTPIANKDYPYGSGLSESGGSTELEYVGEIKFDFLGIKTLRVFKDMIGNLANWDINKMRDLNHKLVRFNDIDIDDPLVYKFLEQAFTEGVFQFGSSGMRRMLKMLKPQNMEDLSALNALYRPGPLGSGMHKEIAKAKETKSYGVSLWDKKILPYVENIVSVTNYQILYEEQTMLIGKVIANYSDEDLNDFRKFLKKPKRDAQFFVNQKRFYDAFMNNGEKKGISKEALQLLWDKLVEFSKYSFNKCLSGDTLVQTINGTKKIKYFNKGDRVLSYDIDSDDVIETEVISLHRNGKKKIYSIMTSDGEEIKCTLDHKFLLTDNKMYPLKEILDNDVEIKNLPNIIKKRIIKFLKETLKEIGYRQTYDLEINHKDHNFLIGNNPIITSNSHSMSYAYNSFLCSYFATYYPLDWYATLLKHEDPIEFIPVIKDHIEKRRLNIKLIPPKLNVSRNYPIPVHENNTIILGTSLIKGVGPKSSIELGRINKIGKDYFTLDEFLNCPDIDHRRINKGVVEKLILIGYFDDFGVDRVDLLLDLERSKLSKKKLLEWNENEKENNKKFIENKYGIIRNKDMFLYKKELEYLGTAIMEHPIKDELPKVIDLLKSELPFGKRKDAIPVVVNRIEQVRLKKTKKGKKFLATSFRDIDGNLYWMNIWDDQIEELKNNHDFDLENPNDYNRTCVMLISDSNGWKNLLNFIAIE
jgi:DNA polymerase III alpha subunit